MKYTNIAGVAVAIASVVSWAPARAQTWIGAANTDFWSAPQNWNPNGTPANNGTANIFFAGTLRTTPEVDQPRNIRSLTFNINAAPFVIIPNFFAPENGLIRIGVGGMTNNDADTQTIICPIALNSAQTWRAAAGNLHIYTLTGGGFPLTIDGAFDVTIDAINDNSSTSLAKNGAGTLTLTYGSHYAGPTTVNAGTMKLSGEGSFASSPVIDLAGGATLDVASVTGGANFDGTRFALAAGQTLVGGGAVVGAIGIGPGAVISIGAGETLNLSSNAEIDAGTVTVAGGSLSAVNIVDNGTLSMTAGTITTPGVLAAGNDGTLNGGTGTGNVLISGGSVSAGAVLLGSAGGGSGDLSVSGTGELTTNRLAGNDVIVNGGTVTVLDEPGGPPDPVLDGSMVGGYLRNGAFYVNAGSVTAPNVKLGITAGMAGTYEQTGGTLAAGSVYVGSSAGGIGEFRWSGGMLSAQSLEMAGPATLGVSLSGPELGDGYAQLELDGHATLAGTLEITRTDGFEPSVGQSFVIMTFASRTGTFSAITGMDAGPGQTFHVQYNSGDVTLVVLSEFGDCDEDGDIDLDDYDAFTACLDGPGVTGAGCECADFDGDDDADLADFAEFQVALPE